MKYEEAKSIRDYGMFLEECNLPGLAKDNYNKAYEMAPAAQKARIEGILKNL